ncbi:MAG: class D sortase [Thermoanaerobaculia bacterium]
MLRRVEITLLIIGVSLLGVALGATLHRRNYQAEQEQAFDRVMAASQLASRESAFNGPPASGTIGSPSVSSVREPAADELYGPPAPEESDLSTREVKPEPKSLPTVAPRTTPPSQPAVDELDPNLLGRIVIPRLGLSAFVLEGEDESTFQRAVGFLPGTARPGEGGNTALAAHRDTFFRPLERLEIDDRIRLEVPPNTYEYRVASLRIVESNEVSVLESTGTEELTLVTCYPFRMIGPAPDRFIVKATRIQ